MLICTHTHMRHESGKMWRGDIREIKCKITQCKKEQNHCLDFIVGIFLYNKKLNAYKSLMQLYNVATFLLVIPVKRQFTVIIKVYITIDSNFSSLSLIIK